MFKKIALLGVFSCMSFLSSGLLFQKHNASPSHSLPKVETQPMRGGPCLPGVPRC